MTSPGSHHQGTVEERSKSRGSDTHLTEPLPTPCRLSSGLFLGRVFTVPEPPRNTCWGEACAPLWPWHCPCSCSTQQGHPGGDRAFWTVAAAESSVEHDYPLDPREHPHGSVPSLWGLNRVTGRYGPYGGPAQATLLPAQKEHGAQEVAQAWVWDSPEFQSWHCHFLAVSHLATQFFLLNHV